MTNDGTGAFDRIAARTQEPARQKVRSRLEWEGAAYEESHLNLPSRLHVNPKTMGQLRAADEIVEAMSNILDILRFPKPAYPAGGQMNEPTPLTVEEMKQIVSRVKKTFPDGVQLNFPEYRNKPDRSDRRKRMNNLLK